MNANDRGSFSEHEAVEITQVHGDLSQEVVRVTVDKLSLILHKHAEGIGHRRGWIAPLGILLTIVVVFATSDFKKFVWSSDTWAAVFLMAGGLTVLWLISAVRKARKTASIDDLVDKIKKQE